MNDGRKANIADTERLVRASQAGDRGAFDALVRLYQRRAMEVAVRVLGSANQAADAVQAAFVKAYLRINKLREARQFEAWLLRITSNEAVNQARLAKCRARALRVAGGRANKAKFSLEDRQSGQELKEAISQAMLKLSKKQARAIALFGLEDFSHKEVAEIMGCSVEAARWHVFSARKKLRVLLKEYLE